MADKPAGFQPTLQPEAYVFARLVDFWVELVELGRQMISALAFNTTIY